MTRSPDDWQKTQVCEECKKLVRPLGLYPGFGLVNRWVCEPCFYKLRGFGPEAFQ